jgi:hypothetical protein
LAQNRQQAILKLPRPKQEIHSDFHTTFFPRDF